MGNDMTAKTEVRRIARPDGTEHIVVRPEPAVFNARAFSSAAEAAGEDARKELFRAIKGLVESGIKVSLTPEGRCSLLESCPEALDLLEKKE